ncbi:efflux RND transporter periplasmic adaptor subunit [Halomonas piscis]|uniref:Efflux RND transporter periplasmic adaptor subunit n=1 Tax=Halomonas piscis TaxID=3031727 RepID=A0ABY9YXU3_9GAMM|nr:efflux RND transporter periplasmic adaptor subunit [Halomonas piscis]WNK19437.1 efflux RND transporter periplasmic adaptor subunit [Halomonas piscis]
MKTTLSRVGRAAAAVGASVLLAACGGEEASDQQGQQGGEEQGKPRSVEVTTLERQDVALEKSYPALLRSDDEVTLVARVTGTLEKRLFEPGQMVEKGDTLYRIEPDRYQTAVNQRKADLESARAKLSRAQRDAERFERLLSQNSVSRQQYDQALADRRVAQASVAQASAALESANIDLDYAGVTAPVSGMISLSMVNVGNLVDSGTRLATITPLDPLEVRFQLPQKDAYELRHQLKDGADIESIGARLELPGSDTGLSGHLDFLGARVDEATSTVQANANFANPDGQVLPGQYVRVHLEGLKRYDVLAVPEIALTQGLMGPQVFVLDEEDKARAQTVDLGDLAGPWQILRDGVEAGDRVVVGDPAGLKPGTPIKPESFDGDAGALMEEAREEKQAEEQQEKQEAQEAQQEQQQAPGEDAESSADTEQSQAAADDEDAS